MAKSVNALGQIAQVKKEIARKEKAYEDNKKYEELKEQQAEPMPIPVERSIPTAPIQEQPVYQAAPPQPSKKSMSDLFEKRGKEKVPMSFKVDKEVYREIERVCKAYNIKKSYFINKAIDLMLSEYDH